MFSFTFLGKDSYTDYGITIKERPEMPLPKRRVDMIEVEGRDGVLINDYGTYDSFTLKIECMLVDAANYVTSFRNIRKWLSGGYGDIVFSDETDVKYQAICVNQINFEQAFSNYGEFVLIFEVQPLKMAVSNSAITKTTSPATFSSPSGVMDGKPVMKVTGSGNVTVTLNGTVVALTGISGYVTVDSLLVDCYKDAVLKNDTMTGDFPELIEGTNNLSWTGTVTSIEIIPNWRYI